MKHICEAYEDNAGGLHIFALDGGAVVWGGFYYGYEWDAAQDWGSLMVQGLDPVAEGWETDGDIDFDEDYEFCVGYARAGAGGVVQIASSEWQGLPSGIDTGHLGGAGTLFAIECGAINQLEYECGEPQPGVSLANEAKDAHDASQALAGDARDGASPMRGEGR